MGRVRDDAAHLAAVEAELQRIAEDKLQAHLQRLAQQQQADDARMNGGG